MKRELHAPCDRRIRELERQVVGVYSDRAALVSALAALFPSGVGFDPSEPEYPVVYIDLPSGQVSYHIAPTDYERYFKGRLPQYQGRWDGMHGTKKDRLLTLWRKRCHRVWEVDSSG